MATYMKVKITGDSSGTEVIYGRRYGGHPPHNEFTVDALDHFRANYANPEDELLSSSSYQSGRSNLPNNAIII